MTKQTSDWQPIETAPKDKPFLGYIPTHEVPIQTVEMDCEDESWVTSYTSEMGWWWSLDKVTHWQPLPEPPKENK